MAAHIRVRLSYLLLELASCVASASVPSEDVGKDVHDLPSCSENAAKVDVVGAAKYAVVVGGSTLNRANASFEYEGLTFRVAVNQTFAQASSGGCRYFWPSLV